jgi:hypothetical protein
MLLFYSRCFDYDSVSARKKGSFDKISSPTTDIELFETKVSISGKLAIKPACELLWSYAVSLTTVKFLVGVYLI